MSKSSGVTMALIFFLLSQMFLSLALLASDHHKPTSTPTAIVIHGTPSKTPVCITIHNSSGGARWDSLDCH